MIQFRKRKDLDEEAYRRWLDSDERCRNAYMGILQFDPSFVGVRWLDDWAVQTVLATCIYVWNNRKRRGSSMIDSDDLAFLINHVHGLGPFWGNHRPWWELREMLTIWNTSPESSSALWVLLRIHLEESIIFMVKGDDCPKMV
ncbi:hypothetical protein OROGR_006242 [Orobanche gracilis]